MPSPMVSIVIPSYLSSRTIVRTLNSIRGQLYIGEVVISLNGNDNSEELIADFRKGNPEINVRILKAEEVVLSADANWNRAVKAANFEFTKLLCADDELMPNSIQWQVEFLAANPSCVLVSGLRQITDFDGKILRHKHGGVFLKDSKSYEKCLVSSAFTGGNPIGEPSAVLFRTSQLKQALPWSKENPYVIDLEMYLKLLRTTQMNLGFIRDEVSTFRVSNQSWSLRLIESQGKDFRELIMRELTNLETSMKFLLQIAPKFSSRLATLGRRFFYFKLSKSTGRVSEKS